MKKLLLNPYLLLSLQILFFAIWGFNLINSYSNATKVIVDTNPYDPRDYLKGYFVALRYNFADACKDEFDSYHRDEAIYVKLAKNRIEPTLEDGDVEVFEAIDCTKEKPTHRDDEVWMKGKIQSKNRIDFGLNKFFVPEESELREVRSGQVYAEILVNKNFSARLNRLVKKPTKADSN